MKLTEPESNIKKIENHVESLQAIKEQDDSIQNTMNEDTTFTPSLPGQIVEELPLTIDNLQIDDFISLKSPGNYLFLKKVDQKELNKTK